MLHKFTLPTLTALSLAFSSLAISAPSLAQALVHPVGHYSGERMHSEFWRQHYRSFNNEDRGHDDAAATQFDQPIGEGVR